MVKSEFTSWEGRGQRGKSCLADWSWRSRSPLLWSSGPLAACGVCSSRWHCSRTLFDTSCTSKKKKKTLTYREASDVMMQCYYTKGDGGTFSCVSVEDTTQNGIIHVEYLTSFKDPKRQEGLCCVPGDGSKHAGDCGQAQFERVQLTHDYPLQVKALQILQTSHTHTHTITIKINCKGCKQCSCFQIFSHSILHLNVSSRILSKH